MPRSYPSITEKCNFKCSMFKFIDVRRSSCPDTSQVFWHARKFNGPWTSQMVTFSQIYIMKYILNLLKTWQPISCSLNVGELSDKQRSRSLFPYDDRAEVTVFWFRLIVYKIRSEKLQDVWTLIHTINLQTVSRYQIC